MAVDFAGPERIFSWSSSLFTMAACWGILSGLLCPTPHRLCCFICHPCLFAFPCDLFSWEAFVLWKVIISFSHSSRLWSCLHFSVVHTSPVTPKGFFSSVEPVLTGGFAQLFNGGWIHYSMPIGFMVRCISFLRFGLLLLVVYPFMTKI